MPKFLSFILLLCLFGCRSNQLPSEPMKIMEAHYFVKNNLDGESGYQFNISVRNMDESIGLTEISLKGLITEHFEVDTLSNRFVISGYIPISSTKIRGFKRKISTYEEDGIIYELQKKKYIYPLKFEYKN